MSETPKRKSAMEPCRAHCVPACVVCMTDEAFGKSFEAGERAPLDQLVTQIAEDMRAFERRKPGGQQTREKSAREMVGEFAYRLEAALAEVETLRKRVKC